MEEHESLKYILRIFSKEVQYFECKYWTNEKKDKAVEESIEIFEQRITEHFKNKQTEK